MKQQLNKHETYHIAHYIYISLKRNIFMSNFVAISFISQKYRTNLHIGNFCDIYQNIPQH